MNAKRRRFMAKVEKSDGCWEWTAAKLKKGYGKFSKGRDGWELAHRASWRLKHGQIPQGMQVLHRCDNPSCVRPSHLFLGVARDNTHDMIRKGRARFHFHVTPPCGARNVNFGRSLDERGRTRRVDGTFA